LIDLHLHLEGSLPPPLITRLARRHHVDPPSLAFDGFRGFLRAFGAVCDLLRDPEDFEAAAAAVLDRAARRGLAHVEVLFSPQVFLRRGVPLSSIVEGLARARRRARGLSMVYIADGARQWGPEWFEQVVAALAPMRRHGLAGIGLGGDEGAMDAAAYAPAFRRARALGLRTTVHAGEAKGSEGVREALRLPLDRIGHGVRAAEDASLLRELARRRIPLEVCPTSNVATGVVPDLASHPLPRLLAAGVRVTINSDDGTFFGTDARREMARASAAFGWSAAQRGAIVREAAGAAFLSARSRAALIRTVSGKPPRPASA
jgi:adenosine deaminase